MRKLYLQKCVKDTKSLEDASAIESSFTLKALELSLTQPNVTLLFM